METPPGSPTGSPTGSPIAAQPPPVQRRQTTAAERLVLRYNSGSPDRSQNRIRRLVKQIVDDENVIDFIVAYCQKTIRYHTTDQLLNGSFVSDAVNNYNIFIRHFSTVRDVYSDRLLYTNPEQVKEVTRLAMELIANNRPFVSVPSDLQSFVDAAMEQYRVIMGEREAVQQRNERERIKAAMMQRRTETPIERKIKFLKSHVESLLQSSDSDYNGTATAKALWEIYNDDPTQIDTFVATLFTVLQFTQGKTITNLPAAFTHFQTYVKSMKDVSEKCINTVDVGDPEQEPIDTTNYMEIYWQQPEDSTILQIMSKKPQCYNRASLVNVQIPQDKARISRYFLKYVQNATTGVLETSFENSTCTFVLQSTNENGQLITFFAFDQKAPRIVNIAPRYYVIDNDAIEHFPNEKKFVAFIVRDIQKLGIQFEDERRPASESERIYFIVPFSVVSANFASLHIDMKTAKLFTNSQIEMFVKYNQQCALVAKEDGGYYEDIYAEKS